MHQPWWCHGHFTAGINPGSAVALSQWAECWCWPVSQGGHRCVTCLGACLGWTVLVWGWDAAWATESGFSTCWFTCLWQLQECNQEHGQVTAQHCAPLLYHPTWKHYTFLQWCLPRDKEINPFVCTLPCTYRQLEDPHSHGQRDLHNTLLLCV